MKKTELEFIIKRTAAAYRQSVTPDLINAYYSALGHLPRMVLVSAARLAMERCKFFPSVSELSQAAAEIVTRYNYRPDFAFDEATLWTMYLESKTAEELTAVDVNKIYDRLLDKPEWIRQCLPGQRS